MNIENFIATNIDSLLPRMGENGGPNPTTVTGKYPEAAAFAELPEITLNDAVTTIVKTVLGWGMIFTLIAIAVAGIYMLIDRGKEEDFKKGTSIILYLVVGMLVMAGAYGLVSGVLQFEIFSNANS